MHFTSRTCCALQKHGCDTVKLQIKKRIATAAPGGFRRVGRASEDEPMGTFWSYFLEFFGLQGLMGGGATPATAQAAPALVADRRGDVDHRGR